jgi:hypothetical protein
MVLASGAVLLYRLPPGSLVTAAAWAGAGLVAVTAAAVIQARNMTRLRQAALPPAAARRRPCGPGGQRAVPRSCGWRSPS